MNALLPFLLKSRDDAEQLFAAAHRRVCVRTDKLIAVLMSLQWPGAVVAAYLIGARSWEGTTSVVHPHLLAAIYLGGLITIPPVALAIFRPGERSTRHVVAACQMLMSGLLIDITGGQIETHFHVFGSLAFLAFYLDWEVLVTATMVILLHHIGMEAYAPLAIFGSTLGSGARLIEHVLWVAFCDCFLITSSVQSLKGLRRITANEAEQKLLLQQAYHDALTGLGNRLMIHQALGEILEQPFEKRAPFALMSIDLDRFKEVNDTLGHGIGDLVLIEVSARIKEAVGEEDIVVRMEGDEFALVLKGCEEPEMAQRCAERIIAAINRPYTCGDNTVQIGVSVGICLSSEGGEDISDLFRHADFALYKAKKSGRNEHCMFDSAMLAETLRQMSLEHRLRLAIHETGMELFYQPIVDTDKRLLGFEALLRWSDSMHGNVSPGEFIPIAEKTGLIVPLGNWVLREACNQAAQWYRSGVTGVRISVNISSLQLVQKDFVPLVFRTLKETGLPPELLDLELTETTLIENHGETMDALQLLHKYGIHLSIDDFGTGYSSFSYLRDMPVHILKIDRSFITGITGSVEARALVVGMIEMAHSLRLRVVAEGVEDEDQMEILRQAECDEIQGWLISKAVPALETRRFMESGPACREMGEAGQTGAALRKSQMLPIAGD